MSTFIIYAIIVYTSHDRKRLYSFRDWIRKFCDNNFHFEKSDNAMEKNLNCFRNYLKFMLCLFEH